MREFGSIKCRALWRNIMRLLLLLALKKSNFVTERGVMGVQFVISDNA